MDETNTTIEEGHKLRLEMGRKAMRTERVGAKTSIPSAGTKINPVEMSIVLGFAILVDVADILVIGSIPVAGDVLDVLAGASIWLWVLIRGLNKNRGVLFSWGPWIATGVELIPFVGDIPPSYAISVMAILIANSQSGRKILKTISPI
jgi:hypothetical protein